MNLWVRRLFCLFVTLGGVLWYSVSPVVAESPLTIPQEMTHEGLTFDSGLEYTSSAYVEKVTLVFEAIEEEVDAVEENSSNAEPELFLVATKEDEVMVEEIVLPTPKKEQPTPTPTITKKVTPTTKPTVLAATTAPTENPVSPTTTPEPTTAPTTPAATALPAYATNGSLNADTLFAMVNQKRSEAGLPAFEKHPDVCSVAEARRGQIENEVYGSSSIHAGFRAMDLPFRASENMISQQSEDAALNWWMNSSIHRAGILGGSKYACLICQNKTCAMIMSSLEPK